ncbi:MAG: hypothetical protein ACTSQJ_12435 [Promethearchaeota archaeon]
MGDFLVDGIWILKTYSGVCLFEENYVDFKKEGISKDLITGFLAAILHFTEEAFKDEIEYIKFKNHKIIFKFCQNILFVIAVRDQEPLIDAEIYKTIDIIVEKFNNRFQNKLQHDIWNGAVKIFDIFSNDIKDIVKRHPLKIKLLKQKRIERFRKKEEERRKRIKEELKRTVYNK